MASGSITTLGLGSGLELQNILDQLKEVDSARITAKEQEKVTLQEKTDAYNSVNAKLFNIKSNALSLSLESDFLKTSVAVSDEEIASVTANDGISATSFDLEVTRKARYNTWQSGGVSGGSALVGGEPSSGVASADTAVTASSQTYDILYGPLDDQQTISVTVDAGKSLTEIAEAINTSASNQDSEGSQLVTASVEENDNGFYIRLSATGGGDSVGEQVQLSGFDYMATDSIIGIGREDSEDTMYVSLPPGTTYSELVTLINNGEGNPGVTAALIDTGSGENPYRLTLSSDDTGEDAKITLQNLALTEVNGADESLNAEFTVNGITYERQSNDAITDVISGVTINIKKVGETTVGVTQDTEAIKENILSLVENFNDLLTTISGDTGEEEETDEETTGPLENDYTVASTVSRLKNLLTTAVDVPGIYKSFGDIGLEIERDGTLTINEDTLDQALAANPDAVSGLFLGNTDSDITGLGDLINDAITDLVSSTGVITTELDALETRMSKLDTSIATATAQLNKRYDTLTASFVRLDTYIAQLNNESDYLTSVIDSFNNAKD